MRVLLYVVSIYTLIAIASRMLRIIEFMKTGNPDWVAPDDEDWVVR